MVTRSAKNDLFAQACALKKKLDPSIKITYAFFEPVLEKS